MLKTWAKSRRLTWHQFARHLRVSDCALRPSAAAQCVAVAGSATPAAAGRLGQRSFGQSFCIRKCWNRPTLTGKPCLADADMSQLRIADTPYGKVDTGPCKCCRRRPTRPPSCPWWTNSMPSAHVVVKPALGTTCCACTAWRTRLYGAALSCPTTRPPLVDQAEERPGS